MTPAEYYLDIVSGRFLDGETLIPINNPSFFSPETKNVSVNVYEIRNNTIRPRIPAKNSRLRARLGTGAARLSDIADVTTAPPVLITALASVATGPSSQATGLGTIATYSPITATFIATVTTVSVITADIQAEVFYIPPITATVTAAISTVTQFVSITTFPMPLDGLENYYESPAFGESPFVPRLLKLTPVLNTTVTAIFSTSISAGEVITIGILNDGSGYPNGVYSVTVSGGSPSVEATALATASGGNIISISITCGGIGYSSAPAATIFKPARSVIDINPSNYYSTVNGNKRFLWALCKPSATPPSAQLSFSLTDTTSTATGTSVPSASILFIENIAAGGLWELRQGVSGYGYVNAPTITHGSITVARPILNHALFYGERSTNDSGIYETTVNYEGVIYGNNIDNDSQFRAIGANIYYRNGTELVRNWPGILSPNLFRFNPYTANGEYTGKFFAKAIRVLDLNNELRITDGGVFPTFSIDSLIIPFAQTYNAVNKTLFISNINTLSGQISEILVYAGEVSASIQNYLSNDVSSEFQHLTIPGVVGSSGTHFLARLTSSTSIQLSNEIGSVRITTLPSPSRGEDRYVVDRQRSTIYESMVRSNSFSTYPVVGAFSVFPVESNEGSFNNGLFGKLEVVDFGSNYSSIIPNSSALIKKYSNRRVLQGANSFQKIGYIRQGYSIVESPIPTNIIVTTAVTNGFRNTILSSEITISTRPGESSIEHFISNGGFGYVFSPRAQITSVSPANSGNVISSKITNVPKSYVAGEYDCIVQSPTVGTAAKIKLVVQDVGSTQKFYTYIEDSGNGYTSAPIVTAIAPNRITGQITNLRILNNPTGYEFNQKSYPLQIAESPTTGGTGIANLSFFKSRQSRRVIDTSILPSIFRFSGSTEIQSTLISGVLPSPTAKTVRKQVISRIRAEENGRPLLVRLIAARRTSLAISTGIASRPDGLFVAGEEKRPAVSLTLLEQSQGYFNVYYAEVYDEITETEGAQTSLVNFGFGYSSAPTVTAPTPDTEGWGKIQSIILTNRPVGYLANTDYALTIESSPSQGGSAIARFSVGEGGIITPVIDNGGYGYTSPPTITAQGPNAPQGIVLGATITTLGRGYAPGQYACSVTTPPSGRAAEAVFVVNNFGSGLFKMSDGGEGYITAPILSVITPSGNFVSGITITCSGSFYDLQDAVFNIIDGSGAGAVIGSPVIQEGKITFLPVVNGGYNYSNTPKIEFLPPLPPVVPPIPANQINGVLNITAASGNAVLSNFDQRTILLEVYETDGTNEQVVAQTTVNLTKRVKE